MARSRGRSAPARSAPSQTRSTHTAAAPARRQAPAAPAPAAAAPAQQRQPGLFAQMASTAAGVAVGSAVGHTLANGVSSIFSGGSAAAPEQLQAQQMEQEGARPCDVDARNFTRCLDENSGNMQICDWYLQQLKACQAAASNY